jgi:hypothetical protein
MPKGETMDFTISGLSPELFAPLFELSDAELAARGAKRVIVEEPNAVPCRVSLEDAAVGEEVILLPYQHLDVPTPYRSSGPIFVRKAARRAARVKNAVPDLQRRRLSSVRAYDADGWLIESEVVAGTELESLVRRFLEGGEAAYLHVHNARPGCFAFRVDRA